MKHPTSIQWQMLLDITEPVFLNKMLSEKNFDMSKSYSMADDMCDTVFCVGGWAAIAFGLPKSHYGDSYYYKDGANQIADILGFKQNCRREAKDDLKAWAFDNIQIWGNEDGAYMFGSGYAYATLNGRRARKLSDVWHHWKRVRDRTIEWEEKNL